MSHDFFSTPLRSLLSPGPASWTLLQEFQAVMHILGAQEASIETWEKQNS